MEKFLASETWVKKIKKGFLRLDVNKNGYVSLENYTLWVDNIEKEHNQDPEMIARLREVQTNFAGAYGLKPGVQFTQDQFVKAIAGLAASESARKQNGERLLMFDLIDAWYDVVDSNHDGTITLDEYKKIFRARNLSDEAAEAVFRCVDQNHNGKLKRSELNDQQFKFWFTIEGGNMD